MVKWPDIISNVDVKEDQTTTGESNHQNTQMELDSIGHTLRKANSYIKKLAIEWNPQRQFKRGRANNRLLTSDVKKIKLTNSVERQRLFHMTRGRCKDTFQNQLGCWRIRVG